MAYQLSDLQTEVLREIKDPTFSTQLIADYFNRTQREVLGKRRYPFMEVRASVTLSSGNNTYTPTSDVQIVDYIALTASGSGTEPTYVEHREFMENRASYGTVTARPLCYTIYGGVIIFDNYADKDYTLTIHYIKKPTTLTNAADVPVIPEDFKDILLQGAFAGVEHFRGNYDIESVHLRRVEDVAQDLRLRYGRRQSMRPRKNAPRRFRGSDDDDAWS